MTRLLLTKPVVVSANLPVGGTLEIIAHPRSDGLEGRSTFRDVECRVTGVPEGCLVDETTVSEVVDIELGSFSDREVRVTPKTMGMMVDNIVFHVLDVLEVSKRVLTLRKRGRSERGAAVA